MGWLGDGPHRGRSPSLERWWGCRRGTPSQCSGLVLGNLPLFYAGWCLKDRWLHTYIRQSNFSLIFFLCGKIFHNDNDSVAHSGNIADLNDEKSTKRLLQTIRLYRPTSVFFVSFILSFYIYGSQVLFSLVSVCGCLSVFVNMISNGSISHY